MRTILIATLAALALAAGPVSRAAPNNPYPPEGGKKILYSALSEDPQTLDPVRAGDTLSGGVMAQIYDALYEYKYLVRPYELKPALAAALPQVSADGLTYTIPLKKGVVFQDDPCFKATGGHGREVTADDIIYGIKRLMDVANKPTGSWMLQGKVVGLDEFYDESVKRAAAGEDMDYSMPVAGLQAPDPYTLRIQLKERYPQLKYALAMPYTAPVPHEAVEVYPDDFVNHPVGTGAFRLKEWTKRWRIILERNPTYRDDRYPGEGEPGDREAGLLDAAGERLPIVDEIYLSIVSEAQPAWLLFKEGYLDASGISKDNFKEAISPSMELTPDFRAKGITLTKTVESAVYYVGFNMTDPVVGANVKLRRAISMAYYTEWRIKNLFNGRAIPAQGPIPPGIFGYDPDFKNPYTVYDPKKAAEMLAEAGYPDGVGEDGRRLTITYDIGDPGQAGLQRAQAFYADMAAIGIHVDIQLNTWAQFLRKAQEGRLQVFELGWILDYPDPENFLQLFYGPNKAPGPNATMYDNPEYNKLFEQMKSMDDTPERLAIIRKMVDMVVQDAVWVPTTYSVAYSLRQRWLKNAKPNDLTGGFAKYRGRGRGAPQPPARAMEPARHRRGGRPRGSAGGRVGRPGAGAQRNAGRRIGVAGLHHPTSALHHPPRARGLPHHLLPL